MALKILKTDAINWGINLIFHKLYVTVFIGPNCHNTFMVYYTSPIIFIKLYT